jgi:hypothetical protein
MLYQIKFVHILTVLSVIIAASIMFTVMLGDDFKDSELRTQIVTATLGLLALAAGYWFNSSNESNRKTDLLAQAQPVEPK